MTKLQALKSRGLHRLPSAPAAGGGGAGVTALRAYDFHHSQGACTHLNYGGTPYTAAGGQTAMTSLLTDTKIKHLRDGWGTTGQDTYAASIATSLGVRFCMVHTWFIDGQGSHPGNRLGWLNYMMALYGPSGDRWWVDIAEGPNEVDANPSFGTVAEIKADMVRMCDQRTTLGISTSYLKIAAPSMADTNTTSKYTTYGALDSRIDYGTTHDYPGNQNIMNQSIISTLFSNWEIMAPGKDVISTETGHTTYTSGTGGYPAITEAQQARWLPTLYTRHFFATASNGRRIVRSFNYNLLEKNTTNNFEGGFGLMRDNLTRKPICDVLQNQNGLIEDLGGTASTFTPGALDYTLSNAPSNLRQGLLQKANGRFYLELDREQQTTTSQTVTVTLTTPATTINVFRPNTQSTATQTGSGTSIAVSVDDTAVWIEIIP